MYAAETWSILKNDEQMLDTWEGKILRKMYGTVQEDQQWKIITNGELMALFHGPCILKETRGERLSSLGHVQRMRREVEEEEDRKKCG